MLRTSCGPALVMPPRRVRAPDEYSEGVRPVKPINAGAEPNRRSRRPRRPGQAGQLGDPAVAAQPPHHGGQRVHAGPPAAQLALQHRQLGVAGIQRRQVGAQRGLQRRLGEGLPVQPRAVLIGPPGSPPDAAVPCSSAPIRCIIRLRSSTRSARVRIRSRTASSCSLGTRIAVSSPARCDSARRAQSRRSVLTRSAAAFGISAGATTSQATPSEVSSRCSS